MSRYHELKMTFEEKRYFKIVCGAGNEDAEEVRKLSLVYTLAGALGIDVSANVDVVKGAVGGVGKAFDLAPVLGKTLKTRPYINVSIGMRGDPHIRKAIIDSSICISCGKCRPVCLQKAIDEQFRVIEKRCIGCGECSVVCPVKAVSFFDKRKELENILPQCLKNGAETFELHAIIPDDESVMKDWQLMSAILKGNYISVCLDRLQLSDEHILRRLFEVQKIVGDRFIVQADGVPMSGGSDSFNTTLQAVAICDMVRKNKVQAMLLASGGTNSKTGELLKLCGVDVNGVSIGTFARKIVSKQIDDPRFDSDRTILKDAVDIAERLVKGNLEQIK